MADADGTALLTNDVVNEDLVGTRTNFVRQRSRAELMKTATKSGFVFILSLLLFPIFLAVFNVPEKSVARAAIILGEIAMMVILMSLFAHLGHHWSVTNMVAPFFNAWLVLTIALVTFVSLMSHRSGFGLCRRQRNVEQTGSNRPAETVV